ncbi:MAG: 2-C-methyl-D-erythritol 4-phosphate cytidylyltransferase [Eubacteriaceae bacterium]|jgi:2-C-methyl-D-erythritol 4-phosphate cytidylyltransferase/2-C-methyl-D-erythritol 2,4-cyclodiphosphate synthase|nr:2-C-methyl-D-erythritol 4-phosphate cytidylyltransferase [Eubacteriaceae bacterium]
MLDTKETGVIIAAAGTGERMGGGVPKQFITIGGEPIIVRTVRAFSESPYICGIVIAAAKDYIDVMRDTLLQHGLDAEIIEGGSSRQESVCRGVMHIRKNHAGWEYVLVHDAARPYVTGDVIERCVLGAAESGASVTCVPVKDTIRESGRTLDRSRLFSVQTPQGFRTEILYEAHQKALADGFAGTDDISLTERIGIKTQMVEGSYKNIKITTPDDVPAETRVGTGYDVHRLTEGRPLVLGGVVIPYDRGLLGHSDADVLLHAVMDALLGAAACGDIGKHFPDTDPEYKGISSMELLRRTGRIISNEGYTVGNIDVTLIAQRPKIAPYIDEMRGNIASALGTATENISVKGTTTEGLGLTGRGEGMAAQAVCALYRQRR